MLCWRMWFAVACLTLRDKSMDFLVTKCAGKGLMRRVGLVHEIANSLVAWRTVRPWCFISIMDYQWLMYRVTSQTIRCCLTLCVRLMTHRAVGDFPVSGMTESTGYLCVLAWMVLKFLALFGVTGQTGRGDIVIEL